MKTYILKRDLPWAKAGTEWEKIKFDGVLRWRMAGTCSSKDTWLYDYLVNDADWFEEKKPERWKPKLLQEYYYVSGSCHPLLDVWYHDNGRYEAGNCFQNREQAEEAAKRVKECLLKFQDELIR